jgi:subtilisin-like proprotein convertase family protein
MNAVYRFSRAVIALLAMGISTVTLAERSLWSEVPGLASESAEGAMQRAAQAFPARQLLIDREGLDELIGRGLSSPHGSFTLDLPAPDGGYHPFEFRLAGTMSPGLAKKFPDIRAFSGRSLGRGVASAQMEVTPAGVSVQVLASEGRWMIDPSDESDASRVKSYFARDAKGSAAPFQCGVTGHSAKADPSKSNLLKSRPSQGDLVAKQSRSRGSELRTYRLAVATTGEYGEYHGGSVDATLSAVVKVINRVNGIFNSELAVGFELVENNEEIIFTDPDADPFEGNFDTGILIDESQAVIDDVIGSENYDIGHTFGGDGGGMASTGPCQDGYKASGVTGGTEGDAFAVDYVAHEIGHQFSMDHTFNTNSDDCLENRSGRAAFEPGAGTTIMSYNGLCSPDDIAQPQLDGHNSDPMFHSFSFEQAVAYLEAEGAACGVTRDTGNSHPTVSAGSRYAVPANTPLYIEGTGSDPDGDSITYSWEQRDLGPAASLAAPDDGAIPLFRTYAPVVSAGRYLPKLESVVAGEFDDTEKMPRKPRQMIFALTARDEAGGRNSDTTQIEVVAEPLVGKTFSVAEPDLGGSLGRVGTVRWHVGETDQAPISVSQVELYLSTDGGNSFQKTPFATTANDGYARVTFPSGIQTDAARIMLKSRNNIFFDVSGSDFTLNSSLAETPEVPAPANVTGVGVDDTAIDIRFAASSDVSYYDAVCVGEPSTAAFTGSAAPAQDFDDTQPLTSTITVSGTGSVSPEGLRVSVDIAHTYRGDVIIKLISPSGSIAELKSFDGADEAEDVVETFTVMGVVGEAIAGEWLLEVSDGYEGDDGRLNSWSLSGNALTPPRTVSASETPDAAFDDENPVSSRIQLSAEGHVSPDEFEVHVDITHEWRSDVVLELEAPSGKRILLRRVDEDDSGDDVKGTYPTTLRSLTPFAELAGEPLSGSWTLHVADQYSVDDGVLNSWGITQKQYVFTGRGTRSPVNVSGLPANQSYECSIAGIFSEVTPPRQSESVSAGKVVLDTQPVASQAETRFASLLATVLGLDPSVSEEQGLTARASESGAARGTTAEGASGRAPNAIPALGAVGSIILSLLMGLVGWRWGRWRRA